MATAGPGTSVAAAGGSPPWWDALGVTADALTPADFEATGRGLGAVRDIAAGDVVVSVPRRCLLVPDDLLTHAEALVVNGDDRSVLSALDSTNKLVVLLLWVASRGEAHPLASYISSLPPPSDFHLPEWWTDAQLEALAGCHAYGVAKKRAAAVRARHAALRAALSSCPHVADLVSEWQRFAWAVAVVTSRGCFWGGSDVGCLVPVLDGLNHRATPCSEAGFDAATGAYQVRVTRSYKAGDQVFISYGPLPNVTLFEHWGFVLPGNPHSSLSIRLAPPQPARWPDVTVTWPSTVAALALHPAARPFALTLDGPEFQALAIARLLAAASAGVPDAAAVAEAVTCDTPLAAPLEADARRLLHALAVEQHPHHAGRPPLDASHPAFAGHPAAAVRVAIVEGFYKEQEALLAAVGANAPTPTSETPS